MDDSINLPFEAKLLVPFIVAFRAAPSCLDDRARFEHIAQVMRRHDSTFTSALAKAAAEALALSLDDLMQKVELGRDVHGPVDRVCVCCGSREMVTMFNRSSTVYSLDACKEVEVVSRQCKWCTTTHSVNEVSTLPAVLVISHPELMKVRGLKAQLEATRYRDPTASLCLVRGFDSIPVKFEMSQRHLSDPRLHLLRLLLRHVPCYHCRDVRARSEDGAYFTSGLRRERTGVRRGAAAQEGSLPGDGGLSDVAWPWSRPDLT